MRSTASGSLIDLWRRMPAAATRLLGEATKHGRPVRALLALLVVTLLGVGGYVAGRALTDPPGGRQAASADPTAPYDGGGPAPTAGAPTPDDRTPGGHTAEPSPSATGESESPSPTTTTETSRPRHGSATGSQSTGSATSSMDTSTGTSVTPSASPSQTDTTPSGPPEDTTPPQTRLSGAFPAPDAALFTFGANEPATFTCSLDGAAYTSCGSPLSYLDLAAGWHTLAVRAADAAGNTDPTPAESSWHSHKGDAAD